MNLLDTALVLKIPLETISKRPGEHTEGWAWTYLKAVLATCVGLADARAIVLRAQQTPPTEITAFLRDCDV